VRASIRKWVAYPDAAVPRASMTCTRTQAHTDRCHGTSPCQLGWRQETRTYLTLARTPPPREALL